MGWSFTVKLLPGEEIVEEGTSEARFGVMAEHTPILTNQRVILKYNTFSSGLVQAFNYADITEADSVTRLMIKYLKIVTGGRDIYLKVDDPETWAKKIIMNRERFRDSAPASDSAAGPGQEAKPDTSPSPNPGTRTESKTDLMIMLDKLRAAGVLTEDEFNDKRKKVLGI